MDYPNKLKFGPQFKILGCLLERPSIGLTLGSFIVGVFGASCFWKWLDGFTSLNWVSIYFLTFSPAGKFLQGCTCRGRSCGTPLWTLIHLIHLFSCFSYQPPAAQKVDKNIPTFVPFQDCSAKKTITKISCLFFDSARKLAREWKRLLGMAEFSKKSNRNILGQNLFDMKLYLTTISLLAWAWAWGDEW